MFIGSCSCETGQSLIGQMEQFYLLTYLAAINNESTRVGRPLSAPWGRYLHYSTQWLSADKRTLLMKNILPSHFDPKLTKRRKCDLLKIEPNGRWVGCKDKKVKGDVLFHGVLHNVCVLVQGGNCLSKNIKAMKGNMFQWVAGNNRLPQNTDRRSLFL